MVAARSPRMLLGFTRWEEVVRSVDWNRVMVEARGMHLRSLHSPDTDACGECISSVLLNRNWVGRGLL